MYVSLENFKLKSRVTKRDPSRSHFPDQFHAPTPLNARFLIEYKMTYIQFWICIYIYFMCPTCFQYANMMITIQGSGGCFQKTARVTLRNSMPFFGQDQRLNLNINFPPDGPLLHHICLHTNRLQRLDHHYAENQQPRWDNDGDGDKAWEMVRFSIKRYRLLRSK